MSSLTIKTIPDELLTLLQDRAKHHHRSLQQEIMAILEEACAPKKLSLDQVRRLVDELGIRTGDESTSWVRALRDAF